MTLQSAFSLERVNVTSTQITKSVNGDGDGGKLSPDRMGMKHRVDNAIYVTYGSMSPQLAERTGFSDADAETIKIMLPKLFEGDASSASYFLAAGAIGGGPVRLVGVGQDSIQGDVKFADALEQMGATVTRGDNWIEVTGSGVLHAIDADFNHIPDAAMTIAVAALYAKGTTTLRNIASWRVKETDRLSAMATELRKLGAVVEEGADYLSVSAPDGPLQAATIDTYDDHRMAMCFSLASLDGSARRGNTIRINDPKCVAKTFPDYFDAFAGIAHQELV